MEELKEIYINYAISSFGKIEMTKLEKILEGAYSHDKFTRMLNDTRIEDERVLWSKIKPFLREYENEIDGCILIDDTVINKPHSRKSDTVCWHYEHTAGRCVKGIQMLNFYYTDCRGISIPLGYEIITKSEDLVDNDGKFIKKISKYSKNEIFREKLGLLHHHNRVKYRYVLADKWFASIDNMGYANSKHKYNSKKSV